MDPARQQSGAEVSRFKRILTTAGAAGVVIALGACAVSGVGVDTSVGVGVGYDAGYYEPGGYEYGAWGPGYRVAPGWGGDRRGGHPPQGYRPAPSSRPVPSIPSHPRGGHR
jgi:hypothetical protein